MKKINLMTRPNSPGCSTTLRILQPAGSGAAVKRYLPTQWCRIGYQRMSPLPDDAFTSNRFVAAYKPGMISYPYLAACGLSIDRPDIQSGLFGVASRLHIPIYKLAATTAADPRRRLTWLNVDRYASLRKGEEGLYEDPGFDGWTFQLFLPSRAPLPGSPVRWDGRFFSVRLPDTLHPRVFEKLLHARIKNASLNQFLKSPAGQEHCAMLGLDPVREQRFTRYKFAGAQRVDPAEELYLFRPEGEDSDRLLIILERIVFDWVVGKIGPVPTNWRDRSQRSRSGPAR